MVYSLIKGYWVLWVGTSCILGALGSPNPKYQRCVPRTCLNSSHAVGDGGGDKETVQIPRFASCSQESRVYAKTTIV